MFTGNQLDGGSVIGCAWIGQCRSTINGYGVNHITFTNDLAVQTTLFAHELGHNLGSNHLASRGGDYIMEPYINDGSEEFYGDSANAIDRHVNSRVCGRIVVSLPAPPLPILPGPIIPILPGF